MDTENVAEIINRLGGNSAVSELCEISSQAVSLWKKKNEIPKAQRKYLEAIRPDIFGPAPANNSNEAA